MIEHMTKWSNKQTVGDYNDNHQDVKTSKVCVVLLSLGSKY